MNSILENIAILLLIAFSVGWGVLGAIQFSKIAPYLDFLEPPLVLKRIALGGPGIWCIFVFTVVVTLGERAVIQVRYALAAIRRRALAVLGLLKGGAE